MLARKARRALLRPLCWLLRRRLRYRPLARFPVREHLWLRTACVLYSHIDRKTPIIAPHDFLDIFPVTYPPRMTYALPTLEHIDWIVMHKAEVSEFPRRILQAILTDYVPAYANSLFVVFARSGKYHGRVLASQNAHYHRLVGMIREQLDKGTDPPAQASARDKIRCAIVVATYNRPAALERTLSLLCKCDLPIVVVDDGSADRFAAHYDSVYAKYPVDTIKLPRNRGLCCAINCGISYFLADPSIDWISIFNDDVEIDPRLFDVLAKIQDKDQRPICTGYDAREHSICGKYLIDDRMVYQKLSTSGVHIHAHRDYWRRVLPVPTPYLGAPKRDRGIPGQGSDSDWWIASWSPDSAPKNDMHVTCIPGLVKTFLLKPEDSTWEGGTVEFQRQARQDHPHPSARKAA